MGPTPCRLRICTASCAPTKSACPVARRVGPPATRRLGSPAVFLATIAATDLLHFPLRVEPGERPDLVLFPPTGRIGIELTEAISTDQARVDALVEREGSSDFRFIPRYRVSDPPRSQAEIRALARSQARILPRMGDSVERDWVEAMLHIVCRKAATFHKPGITEHGLTPADARGGQVPGDTTPEVSVESSGSDSRSTRQLTAATVRPRSAPSAAPSWAPIKSRNDDIASVSPARSAFGVRSHRSRSRERTSARCRSRSGSRRTDAPP